jgi:hypothetical protein
MQFMCGAKLSDRKRNKQELKDKKRVDVTAIHSIYISSAAPSPSSLVVRPNSSAGGCHLTSRKVQAHKLSA